MLSAQSKAEADGTYWDLDYLGWDKTESNIVLLYIVLKKIMINTP